MRQQQLPTLGQNDRASIIIPPPCAKSKVPCQVRPTRCGRHVKAKVLPQFQGRQRRPLTVASVFASDLQQHRKQPGVPTGHHSPGRMTNSHKRLRTDATAPTLQVRKLGQNPHTTTGLPTGPPGRASCIAQFNSPSGSKEMKGYGVV